MDTALMLKPNKLERFTLASFLTAVSCKIFEHFAVQVGFSNWVHKTRIHYIQRWHCFGTKTTWSAFPLEKRLHPFKYWIKDSWSGSTHILYYIKMSVRWNALLRNQISSCQHVLYYSRYCQKEKCLSLWLYLKYETRP
jgi:hypothetical protein